MKPYFIKLLISTLLILAPWSLHAQIDSVGVISNTELAKPQKITTADVDGDGDQDVVGSSSEDESIVWFENLGGSFGGKHVISSSAVGNTFLIEDIDLDSNLEIIYETIDDRVIWREQQDGSFGPAKEVATVTGITGFATGDANADGQWDIFMVKQNDIVWYENQSGSFRTPASSFIGQAKAMEVADFTSDDDVDVAAVAHDHFEISWYENMGGSYGNEILLADTVVVPTRLHAVDINNDDLEDLVVQAGGAGKNYYYINEEEGGFKGGGIVSTIGATSMFTADIDRNGYQDVVTVNHKGLFWYKNQDTDFSQNKISEYLASLVTGNDLDGDGDVDLVVADPGDNTICWYRNNIEAVSVDGSDYNFPKKIKLHNNHPNPFNPTTTIGYSLPEKMKITLSIYNVNGQIIEQLYRGYQQAGKHRVRFNADGISSGIYYYRLKTPHFQKTKKAILLK